ncbi:MAG: hypothetical protein BYD32DRAFT_190613 [Podila humilis]|nr:MAG: hypothetical protein BYD32DRAFT_190613 [Podila humilis]
MSFKPTLLVVLALAVFIVVMSSNQADAQQIPIWCVCDNADYTRTLCQAPLAGGKWDGGSCGLDKYSSYTRFVSWCQNAKDSQHRLHCWN